MAAKPTLATLLQQSGHTLEQAQAMDRGTVEAYASQHGFSSADVTAFLGAAPAAAPSPAAAVSSSPSPYVEGFGGASQWEMTENIGLVDRRVDTAGFMTVSEADAEKPSSFAAPLLSSLGDSLNRLSAANAAMLKGEIPADVAASVRRAAGETSMAGGTFGGAARNLSARDLGKTSMDVMKSGFENETNINTARSALATTYEAIKKTNLARNKELMDMETNVAAGNRDAIGLERMRIASNISANTTIVQTLADLAAKQQLYMIEAAKEGGDTTSIKNTLDSWLSEIAKLLQ